MPSKKEKTKKVAKEEERTPKHVMIRLSYRDYIKLTEVAKAASEMKESKDVKRTISSIVGEFAEDLNADKFLGLIAGLPAKERTLERFYSQPPRAAPAKMYFTDPQKCTKEVTELYEACKKWTKGKLRYDQKKETCPTDVRVMFYTYIREKGLVENGNPDITIDKFLKKIAPKTLSGVKHVKRNNGSLVWEICSEIRGSKKTTDESKKGKKKVVESDEESSEEEKPKRRGKKALHQSDEESSEEEEELPKRRGKVFESTDDEESSEEEEEEPPKKNKSKRR